LRIIQGLAVGAPAAVRRSRQQPEIQPNAFNRRNFRAIELALPLRYTGKPTSGGGDGPSGASDPQSQTRRRRSLETRDRSGIY
jgi:hypothetical protein